MANTYLTPNMNLIIPVPGQDPGPDWANNLISSLIIVDAHTHLNGTGVPITPAAININSPLLMNGFTLSSTGSVLFATQTTTPANLNLYVDSPDLFFVDGNGNNVQLTSGGTVNATSSGISSGSATASFAGGALVVNSNTNTPGNVQCGSVLIGNNVASSNFVTLSAPNALASSYPLVLPTIPSQTTLLTLDVSGNIAAPVNPTIPGILTANSFRVPGNVVIGSSSEFSGSVAFDTNTVSFANGFTVTSGSVAFGSGLTVSSGGASIAGGLTISSMDFVVASGRIVATGSLTVTGTSTISGQNIVVSNTNAAAGLSIIRGNVNSSGVKTSGEGFTVAHAGTGAYTITFTTGFADVPALTISPINPISFVAASCQPLTAAGAQINIVGGSGGVDSAFSFIAIGQV